MLCSSENLVFETAEIELLDVVVFYSLKVVKNECLLRGAWNLWRKIRRERKVVESGANKNNGLDRIRIMSIGNSNHNLSVTQASLCLKSIHGHFIIYIYI